MPLDRTINKVLVIGSGPIVIGQAAEFDYSGTQAIKALKEENVEVVLVNSNPATIMTDRGVADKTYIEPLTVGVLEKVIAKERPDALIAGMGGQTGLNLSVELYDSGVLDKYGVRVIGTSIESIKKGEDREDFKNLMQEINQPIVESVIVTTLKGGLDFAEKTGYPVVVRPAYTLGGTGGGIAESEDELKEILSLGLSLSRVGQALIEKCISGWKEIEFEIIRDGDGNCVTVCSMENVDPVGVHTGDSIVVAPAQTLSGKEYKLLNNAAVDIVTALDIIGGCNIQFAQKTDSFEYAVIEVNPRVSRSSALASKATGYPIAKVSAKIALGLRLDEIKNALTQTTYASFEPTVDYCVVKIPKWPFDKFTHAKKNLGTKMMATGEVMAIAGSFEAAFLKGIRSLEIGQYSLVHPTSTERSLDELKRRVQIPDDERIFDLAEMLRRNYRIDKVSEITGVDKFFVKKISNIVENEEMLKEMKLEEMCAKKLRELKRMGFSDKGIASLVGCKPNEVYERRKKFGILPVYKMVDTCAGEYDAATPYYYSTYDTEDEAVVNDCKKVIVIGSGPIRIGQGIEFDYCSVQSILALKKQNIETIIINNNPETVSTDFDTADKLYFEPLTEEDVLNIVEKENPDGVILQFGGQTAIKLASFFKQKGIPIYGTQPEQIDIAEDREKFDALLETLNITRPRGKSIWSVEEGLEAVRELGFPVLVRPSYVLGGRGMEITYEESELILYLKEAFSNDKDNPILVDKYVEGTEIEVDAICDGENVIIPGIMEHLERAGVHSGDSISIYPSQNISQSIKDEIQSVTAKVAIALEVKGMINIQFIEHNGILYIIEVNPRSSRTVPYISKVTNLPCIEIATRIMLGEKLSDMPYGTGLYKETSMVSVKVPVFSTEKLPMVEVSLGPEMRSTGEVLGIGEDFISALCKGFIAAKLNIPKPGSKILATIRTKDQENFIQLAKRLKAMDCEITATQGTGDTLAKHGVPAIIVKKINEGIPNILDTIRSGLIDMTVNIPIKVNDYETDGFKIRRVSAESSILQITSLDTVEAIIKVMESGIDEKNIQIYSVDEII